MALLNGQRHVPHRDSKISQLLRDSLGNVTCRTCMLAHVSSAVPHYNETLQVIQLAARIHRMKRRRTKFSSTSSEDSSTDESGKFRRPYRGLRMGTLREDVLYSSSHSDPDYTSSSEQSCDTVIYMGANGQSLSDRELTDNEGPPRHVPRTNPRLPRRPSGSRSSGEDSDSGRSRTSDGGRYGPRPTMGIRAGASAPVACAAGVARVQPVPHVISAPGSPNALKLAQRMALHGKMAAVATAAAKPGAGEAGHWADKVTKHRAKGLDTAGEQWVDGPGAAIYPDSGTGGEQWVDGPPAFLLQNDPPQPPPHSPSPRGGDTGGRRLKTRKVEAEEQWVDGPREMMAPGSSSGAGTPTPLHTSSKAEPLCRAVVGQPSQAPKLSTAVSDKALKQALIKHLEKERPDSALALDTPLHLATEAPHHHHHHPGSGYLVGGEGCRGREEEGPPTPQVFLHDFPWDKRQSGDGVSVVGVGVGEEKGPEDYSSLHRKPHKRLQTSAAKHSPKPSPASTRKAAESESKVSASGLHRSDLPGSASPTHRVAQWIKSVTKSDSLPSDAHPLQVTSSLPAPTDVTMADAETNTEHDSDFERLADCDEGSGPQELSTAGVCGVLGGPDSSGDVSRDSGARRDSLYEQKVEDQLENLASRQDRTLLSRDADNDTFSSRDTPDTDSAGTDHAKELADLRVHPNNKLARHRASHEGSPARASADLATLLPDLSKPLLSRKPDGASNPHLNKEFPEEEECAVVNEQCGSAHYAVLRPNADFYVTTAAQVGYVTDGTVTDVADKLCPPCKPPLPQKPACPSPKSNGPSKVTAVSSSCCSSSPPPPSSAPSSSPKSLITKDPPATQKQPSPKGSLLCNGRKDKGAKSGKEKVSVSLSASPVSLSGKSSKGGGKAPAASKLPLFNSSSSSGSSKPSVPATASPSSKDSKLRKKEKDGKAGGGKHAEISLLQQQHKARLGHGDPDLSKGGGGGGAGRQERRLLSPYATVTQPKTNSHSSSGHGSDNSSIISTEVHSQPSSKGDKLTGGGTSSGYESMLRESEETASSTSSSRHDDSGSEQSDRKKGSKRKGTKRSRSAPARSSESPSSTGAGSQGSRVWVDPRHGVKVKDDPLELKRYEAEDVERLQRRRADDPEGRGGERGRERGREVQTKQPGPHEGPRTELVDSRDRISLQEDSGWGLDCKFLFCFCKSRPGKGTDV